MKDIMPLLVLVVPCYNESILLPDSLPHILRVAVQAGQNVSMQVRLIAVNDGSKDQTGECLELLAERCPGLHALHFTRNFGKEAALLAGINHALAWPETAVIVTLDADLQHPPELLEHMLSAYTQGYMVVEAVKRERGPESWLRRHLAQPFYNIFQRWSGLPLNGQTDYKLFHVSVAAQLTQMQERGRFFRGLVAWLGHPSVQLPFDVPPRPVGNTQWSVFGLVRYAWGNLLTFSTVPLKAVTWLGGVGLSVGLVGGIKSIWDYATGQASTGFTTVILLQITFGSLILLALGLIGQYLGRIYEEVKGRPHYVLRPSVAQTQSQRDV